jgi:hypothetical protein
MAIRYAVGIGKPGLYESGTYFVGAKKEWPSWTPTPDMSSGSPSSTAPMPRRGCLGPRQPAGRPCALPLHRGPRRHLPAHPRHQCAADDRDGGVERLRKAHQ